MWRNTYIYYTNKWWQIFTHKNKHVMKYLNPQHNYLVKQLHKHVMKNLLPQHKYMMKDLHSQNKQISKHTIWGHWHTTAVTHSKLNRIIETTPPKQNKYIVELSQMGIRFITQAWKLVWTKKKNEILSQSVGMSFPTNYLFLLKNYEKLIFATNARFISLLPWSS